jgi:DNA-directed RNA polymerase specialized sigma24 family protein
MSFLGTEQQSVCENIETAIAHLRMMGEMAVQKLPRLQMQIYINSKCIGLTNEEISATTEISVESIATQLYNAVRAVRIDLSSRMPLGLVIILTSTLRFG